MHKPLTSLAYTHTRFGDQRVKLGKHVVVMWHRLGEKKANFIPGLIGPYLEITLLKSRQLRTIALPVVVDMMSCEQQASGNFKRVNDLSLSLSLSLLSYPLINIVIPVHRLRRRYLIKLMIFFLT